MTSARAPQKNLQGIDLSCRRI